MTTEEIKAEERRGQARRSTDRATDELRAIYSSLKYITDGIILLNHDGSVYFATEQAQNIVETIKHLIRVDDKITFSRHHDYDRFTKFLAQLNSEDLTIKESAEQCVFMLDREGSQAAVILTCFSFRGDENRIIIVVHDPQKSVPQWAAFAEFFKLTQTELRLCLALTEGFTLNSYSEKYHVSINTSRSQLKTIFSKTETRRQADLLRLIFSFTRH